jgi:hypothetical protein
MKTIAVFAIGVAFSASPAIAQVNMQYIMVKLASNIRDSTLSVEWQGQRASRWPRRS